MKHVLEIRGINVSEQKMLFTASLNRSRNWESCLDSPPHPLVNPSLSLSLLSTSITSSLFHSKLKPTFSTNPFHLRLLLPIGLPSWQRDWTGPITLIISVLVSHFIFLFIPCGILSWLPGSFLLHVKYTLSYRIVSYIVIRGKSNQTVACHCVLQSYTTICTHSEQVLQGSFRFRFIFWFVFVSLSIGPVFVRFIVFLSFLCCCVSFGNCEFEC